MLLGVYVTQDADFNFLVVSTSFEVSGRKELNKHFNLSKIACVRMRKCVEI